MSGRRCKGGALALGLIALAGCVPVPTMGTGAFRDADAATQAFTRGVTTKADVQQRLGAPNGEGAAQFWDEAAPREVWYYEDDRASGSELRLDGVHTQAHQQILFVFFKGTLFDGYVWSDLGADASAR